MLNVNTWHSKTIRRRDVPSGALDRLHTLHPVLARVYAARDITSLDQLDSSLKRLSDPRALSGTDAATALLQDAIEAGARILVIGDFDADGATSTAVAVLALRAMGAGEVGYLVPSRFDLGYGLSPGLVELATRLQPDLLVTVDTGIACLEGVAAAARAGMSVIVTDHHLPGAELPQADAIVNPNLRGERFPGRSLAGVGVVFHLLTALRTRLRAEGWFDRAGLEEPNLGQLLDLVAIGTVADLVPLDLTNRILVSQGLKRINAGRCRPGVRALLEVAGRSPGQLSAADLAFALAPRINAAGRLEDMSVGIECLLTEDASRAAELARTLHEINRQRRELQARMQEQAVAELDRLLRDQPERRPTAICLFDPQWHQGIVGLVASRMCECTHRPAVAFAPGESGEIKGSARSVPGLHVRDVLEDIAAAHPGLIERFGGHAMAAGLTLRADRLEAFREAWERSVAQRLGGGDPCAELLSDGELEETELALELAELLRTGGPWGQGFPEPVFDGVFDVLEQSVVGGAHLRLRLRPEGGSRAIGGICFRLVEPGVEVPSLTRVRVAYRLEVNEYQGTRSPQLVIEYLEPL